MLLAESTRLLSLFEFNHFVVQTFVGTTGVLMFDMIHTTMTVLKTEVNLGSRPDTQISLKRSQISTHSLFLMLWLGVPSHNSFIVQEITTTETFVSVDLLWWISQHLEERTFWGDSLNNQWRLFRGSHSVHSCSLMFPIVEILVQQIPNLLRFDRVEVKALDYFLLHSFRFSKFGNQTEMTQLEWSGRSEGVGKPWPIENKFSIFVIFSSFMSIQTYYFDIIHNTHTKVYTQYLVNKNTYTQHL